jgi:DNA-binding NtrC family response regulator
MEEELFGPSEPPADHAAEVRRGHVDSAHGGTLLIEDLTGLPPTCQAKLLQAVEGRHDAASAHAEQQRTDFRLMATTRHEPAQSVDRGSVREDLYYRLAVVCIRVPPLRERREDIPGLVRQFLAERCEARGIAVPPVEPELMRHLVEQPWPGNVAQLRACLATIVLPEDAEMLGLNHLRATLRDDEEHSSGSSPERRIDTLAELERAAVMRALKICQGNRTQAAKALGISVRTLQRKLRQWDA